MNAEVGLSVWICPVSGLNRIAIPLSSVLSMQLGLVFILSCCAFAFWVHPMLVCALNKLWDFLDCFANHFGGDGFGAFNFTCCSDVSWAPYGNIRIEEFI